jgi:L-amino acid N-acyltransferase YncA
MKVRLARESDASEVLRIYSPIVRETAISFELAPPRWEEMRERMRNILATHVWLVAEDGPGIAGYAYASRFRPREAYQWTAEVTVYVDPPHQRKGIGTALYQALFRVMRLQGYCSAIAVIALPNGASVQLHERFGFRRVGVFERAGCKLGRWHDIGWWQLKLQECNSIPAPPRAIAPLLGTVEWDRLFGE